MIPVTSRLTLTVFNRKGKAYLHPWTHIVETYRATLIHYQSLPTVAVTTVYLAREGHSRLYNKTALA